MPNPTVRRRQVADDRIVTRRDALLADPVTSRLAALLGVTAPRVDLFTALVFAAVLEGVACLLWTLALRSSVGPGAAVGVTIPMSGEIPAVAPQGEATDARHALSSDAVVPLPENDLPDDPVARLAQDIAAGRVRPTVAAIRRHLRCSQARATALRRLLTQLNPPI